MSYYSQFKVKDYDFRILFPNANEQAKLSTLMLLKCVIFSLLLTHHGFEKLINFNGMAATFPDPFGIGSEASLAIAIFGELVCSLGFVVGFLPRLVLIPMSIAMIVAILAAHGGDVFGEEEYAFLYLVVFILSWIAGAGRYSVDRFIGNKVKNIG